MKKLESREKEKNNACYLALSGGIGGAKLALGLEKVINSEKLTIAGNTGDDFEHLGLHISPDLDTLMYTLSGRSDPVRGWGLENESWFFMNEMKKWGGENWFQLGDRDLATHIERTRRLKAGEKLSSITEFFCKCLGIKAKIVPATDDPLKTCVQTHKGILSFQDYFVREKCRPKILSIFFEGNDAAKPCKTLVEVLKNPNLEAILICPSNPFLSIDPILSIKGIRHDLIESDAKVIAISPIIEGDSVKGPTAKILRELGYTVSAFSVVEYYQDLIDGFVLDIKDKSEAQKIEDLGVTVELADTLMVDLNSKIALAQKVKNFALSL